MIEHRIETLDEGCIICECLASWMPVIYTWPIGGKSMMKPTHFHIHMPICDAHRMELSTKDFIYGEVWAEILQWAHQNNKPIPDRMTAEIRFTKISNEKVLH